MKKRLLTNWTFTRALYLIMGIAVIIQFVTSRQWMGAVLGGYIAAMGLFGFGCAGGNCVRVHRQVDRSAPVEDLE